MSQPLLLDHTRAIIQRLTAADLPVGDHVAPRSPDGSVVAPCVVLYVRPGGAVSGALGAPDEDAWLRFQLTSVGQTAEQAMWMADRSHEALISEPFTIEGRLVARVRRTFFGANATRDNDIVPPLFYVPADYGMWTLAAALGS